MSEPLVRYGDARHLPLERESVDCIVTSPPYNVGVEYEGYDDRIDWEAYYEFAVDTALEMYRVLSDGGRCWLNVAPSVPFAEGSKRRVPLGFLWLYALEAVGFQYRDTVVWLQDSFDGAAAWGSWRSPSAPNLRGCYEVVLLFYKGDWKRDPREGCYRASDVIDISNPDATPWTDLCRNVWKINPARRKEGAPAPFPPELVARAIRLSTYHNEVVLDPFAGSGTTVQVARDLGRVGIGYDIAAPKEEAA